MNNRPVRKRSLKSALLVFVLWLILFLAIYENELPAFFSDLLDRGEASYTALTLFFRPPILSPLAAVAPGMPKTPSTSPPDSVETDDILRLLNPEAPTLLNPHLSTAIKDLEVSRITYEPLASFDRDGNLIPFLAAEIPTLANGGVAADGKSVTWKLKQGLKWSDGQVFTAEDVRFTYQFVSNPQVKARSASIYKGIGSVEVLDADTVKINFKEATPGWAIPFVGVQGSVLPRHIFAPYNGPAAQEAPANTLPVGTGPYRVAPPGIKTQEVLLLGTQLVETNKIIFEPNPYFREGDKRPFRRIEFRGGGTRDEAARLVLRDGKMDYTWGIETLPPEVLTLMEQEGRGRLVADFGPKIERIALNRTDPNRETETGERSSVKFPHPFFSDPKVRQAFAYAIDKDACAAVYGPAGRSTNNNLVSPSQYNSPRQFYAADLQKAAALLDEAGWRDTDGDGVRDKDGRKMKIVYQAGVAGAVQKIQQLVKEALNAIGVEVEIKIIDPSIMFGPGAANPDSIFRFNADLQQLAIASNSPDPLDYMRRWTCDAIPQKANNWIGGNLERWCSAAYDALYQQALTELDPEKRRQLFIQMNDLLIEDVVMIPLVHRANVQGVRRDIEGVKLTPWDASTWNIKDWRRVAP